MESCLLVAWLVDFFGSGKYKTNFHTCFFLAVEAPHAYALYLAYHDGYRAAAQTVWRGLLGALVVIAARGLFAGFFTSLDRLTPAEARSLSEDLLFIPMIF
jgi:hypothetical protein